MSQSQEFQFDKFMKDLDKKREDRIDKARFIGKNDDETPQRKLAKRIRERWQERMRWSRR